MNLLSSAIGITLIFCSAFVGIFLSKRAVILLSLSIFTVLGGFVPSFAGFNFTFYWIELFLVFLVMFVLIEKAMVRKKYLTSYDTYKTYTILLTLYLVVLVIGLLIHRPIRLLDSAWELKRSTFCILVYLSALYFIRDKYDIHCLAKCFLLITTVLALELCYSLLTENYFLISPSLALHSDISIGWARSNYISSFFAALFPINLGIFFNENNYKWKSYALSNCIICLSTIIFTLSLGSLFSLVICLMFFSILVYKRVFKFKYWLLILVIFCITSLSLSSWIEFMYERASQHFYSLERGTDLRMRLWSSAFQLFYRHPFFGMGLANASCYMRPVFPMYEGLIKVHNFILQSLMDTGLVGTTFLVYFLGKSFKSITRIVRGLGRTELFYTGLSIGLLVMIVNSLVEIVFDGISSGYFLWFLMGSITAYSRLIQVNRGSSAST